MTTQIVVPTATTNNGRGNPSFHNQDRGEKGWQHSAPSLPHYYNPRDEGLIRSFWYAESNVAAVAERQSMGMPYYYDAAAACNYSVPHIRYGDREETPYYSSVEPNTGRHYISQNSDAGR